MLIATRNKTRIQKLKAQLKKKFDMKDLGEAKKSQVWRSLETSFKQTLAITGELRSQDVGKIQHGNSKTVTTPLAGHFKFSSKKCPQSPEEEISRVSYASVVRSLMYTMVCTRPDLAYTVSTVSRFMSNPGKQYWEAVKWVLQYLRETVGLGLMFQRLKTRKPRVLQGYIDATYAVDLDQQRSTTGNVFTLLECTVSWKAHCKAQWRFQ